jgi:hypothetical protein
MDFSVAEKSSKLRISVCGRKVYPVLCFFVPEFQDTVEPLVYSFLGIDEKYANCEKVEIAGNAKIISLTLNCSAQQIM